VQVEESDEEPMHGHSDVDDVADEVEHREHGQPEQSTPDTGAVRYQPPPGYETYQTGYTRVQEPMGPLAQALAARKKKQQASKEAEGTGDSTAAAQEVERRLTAFFQKHNPAKLAEVKGIVAKTGTDPEALSALNEALRGKYGADLDDLKGPKVVDTTTVVPAPPPASHCLVSLADRKRALKEKQERAAAVGRQSEQLAQWEREVEASRVPLASAGGPPRSKARGRRPVSEDDPPAEAVPVQRGPVVPTLNLSSTSGSLMEEQADSPLRSIIGDVLGDSPRLSPRCTPR